MLHSFQPVLRFSLHTGLDVFDCTIGVAIVNRCVAIRAYRPEFNSRVNITRLRSACERVEMVYVYHARELGSVDVLEVEATDCARGSMCFDTGQPCSSAPFNSIDCHHSPHPFWELARYFLGKVK